MTRAAGGILKVLLQVTRERLPSRKLGLWDRHFWMLRT